MIRSPRRLFGFMAATRSGRRPHFVPRLTILEDRTVLSPLLVTTTADEVNPNDGVLSLREAIAQANADASNGQSDTIRFAGSLGRATITLDSTLGQLELSGVPPPGTSASETIDGAGRITVSGGDASRVFQVDDGVNALFKGLKITHGLAVNGGGILNAGGTLILSHDVISDNKALGAAGQTASGGGIANVNGATATIEFSTLSNNQAKGGNATGTGGNGQGGALYNGPGSTMIVTADLITDNQVVGGTGTGTGGRGLGGGIDNDGGATGAASLTVSYSTLIGNVAQGGAGPTGGLAWGGGILSIVTVGVASDLTVSYSILAGNKALGGGGGGGAPPRGKPPRE
jgi:CSLREA domain-containing protein